MKRSLNSKPIQNEASEVVSTKCSTRLLCLLNSQKSTQEEWSEEDFARGKRALKQKQEIALERPKSFLWALHLKKTWHKTYVLTCVTIPINCLLALRPPFLLQSDAKKKMHMNGGELKCLGYHSNNCNTPRILNSKSHGCIPCSH